MFKKMAQIRLTYFQIDAILKIHCESRGITSKIEDPNGFQKKVKKVVDKHNELWYPSKAAVETSTTEQKSF